MGPAMKESEILRRTSRSFYLTLRMLPSRFRAEAALGYLLARATDTIADTSDAPVSHRLALLRTVRGALGSARIPDYVPADWTVAQRELSERCLLEELPVLWARLAARPEPARSHLVTLLDHVLEGQIFDLERFGPERPPLSHEELERYTYLVAGSVGEFWTHLCVLDTEGVSGETEETMLRWARHYGQGLQLVNILRDRAMDAVLGRIYIPESEVPIWQERARAWLGEGGQYGAALRSGRLRYASLLPAVLGLRTLNLLREENPQLITPRKVSRAEVRLWMRRALAVWWSPRHVERLLAEAAR